MRARAPTPIRNGIVWPAEERVLMPSILFHLMVSSVAARTVLATATLKTDCSLCRASLWSVLWRDQRAATETFGVEAVRKLWPLYFHKQSHSFTQSYQQNYNARSQEQHVEDNVDCRKSFRIEPGFGKEKPIFLTAPLAQCRNAHEPEPELKTRNSNQQQKSQ